MRIAMISCDAYSDAWMPFAALFDRFWPDCQYPRDIISDCGTNDQWLNLLENYALKQSEPFLLMQEDFFISEPVQVDLVKHALSLLDDERVGCVRLLPMPGGTVEINDPFFAGMDINAEYRISCQAAIWRPSYLAAIARACPRKNPWRFELDGTEISRYVPQLILSFKRDVQPWPINYLCSAITKGRWDRTAKMLCDREGIHVDWSRRPFMTAR
jgi:hypothetical protein